MTAGHLHERPAGLLLTGGASRRMGRDKAMLTVSGVPVARRLAAVLVALTDMALEVGPARSGLACLREEPAGEGPLVAFACGAGHLEALGWQGPALLVACDLPLLDESTLEVVARHPSPGSVVPVVAGRAQPLAARWSASDTWFAREAASRGERSMKPMLGRPGVVFLDESAWPEGVAARAFADADTPADWDRLGLG